MRTNGIPNDIRDRFNSALESADGYLVGLEAFADSHKDPLEKLVSSTVDLVSVCVTASASRNPALVLCTSEVIYFIHLGIIIGYRQGLKDGVDFPPKK